MISLLISLFILTPTAFAQDTAQGQSRPGPTTAAPSYYQRECSRQYQADNCAAFFKENPEFGKYAIDCNKPIDPVNELKHCGSGAWQGAKDLVQFIAGALAGIPSAIKKLQDGGMDRQKQLEVYNECAKSDECKIAMWEEAAQKSAPESLRAALRRLKDGHILRNMVQQAKYRANSLRSEEARKILISEPPSPERDQKLEKLIPGWIERQNRKHDNLWNVGLAAGQKLVKKAQCYNREVQLETVCYGLASLIIPGAAIKGVSKFPKLAEIAGVTRAGERARAIERAHKVGIGEVGRDGTAARIGNYTDDQLRRKAEILKEAGFSEAERRALMESGTVGAAKVTVAEASAARPNLDLIKGERWADNRTITAWENSLKGCDLSKAASLSSSCAATIAQINKLHATSVQKIGDESKTLSSLLENFEKRAGTATEKERAAALWERVSYCKENPALAGCRAVIAESNEFLGIAKIPQRGAPAPSTANTQIQAQMTENARQIQSRSLELDFLPEAQRSQLQAHLGTASGHRQARDRFVERATIGQTGADYQWVNLRQATEQVVGPGARPVLEGSKATLVSADGRIKVVFDPLDPYFTVQELTNGQWRYVSYNVARDGTLIRKGSSSSWVESTHFQY